MRSIAIAWLVLLCGPALAQETPGDKVDRLQKAAEAALLGGKPAEAIPLYEQLFEAIPLSGAPDDVRVQLERYHRYNFACALSLTGAKEKAIEALARSIELGFDDWDHIAQDKDLDALRGEEGFVKLLEAGKAKRKKPQAADEPRLPSNPFEKAKEGDWCAFTGKLSLGEQEQSTLMVWRVTSADDQKVAISMEQGLASGAQETTALEFERGRPPTIRAYAGLTPDHRIAKVATEPASMTVGGKELACTKLTFEVSNGEDTAGQYTLFFAPDLPPPGLVVQSVIVRKGEKAMGDIRHELSGWGNGDTVVWGKRPEELRR